MLLLPGREKIESTSQLCAALGAGMTRCFALDTSLECVTVQGGLPAVDLLRIDVSSARLIDGESPLPTPPSRTAERERIASAGRLEMLGEPVRVGEDACVNFRFCASGVQFEVMTDENDIRWLAIADAEEGSAEVDVDRKAVEGLFLRGTRIAAQNHGLEIERAGLTLSSSEDRSVGLDAEIIVRRKRLSAAIMVCGHLTLDQELNAGFFGLSCSGKGAIGALACALIKKHLRKLESKRFPLLGFNLAGLKLREMNVEVGTEKSLHARAIFGGTNFGPQQTLQESGSCRLL
jgi:hypothetical protein